MVAMELVVLWQSFAKHYEGGGGEGCARGRVWLPSLSLTIYSGKGVEEAP